MTLPDDPLEPLAPDEPLPPDPLAPLAPDPPAPDEPLPPDPLAPEDEPLAADPLPPDPLAPDEPLTTAELPLLEPSSFLRRSSSPIHSPLLFPAVSDPAITVAVPSVTKLLDVMRIRRLASVT